MKGRKREEGIRERERKRDVDRNKKRRGRGRKGFERGERGESSK